MKRRIDWNVKLSLSPARNYRVKRGQTLAAIAAAYGIPPRLLASFNALTCEPEEGQVLSLPAAGNLYTVRGGESKTLLCGSPARYRECNGTECLYPGQVVLLK